VFGFDGDSLAKTGRLSFGTHLKPIKKVQTGL